MTTTSLVMFAPIASCLLGALLVLFLEAAGTPAGARKQGGRGHLTLIALLVVGAAIGQLLLGWRDLLDVTKLPALPSSADLLFDGPGRFGALALLLLVAQAVIAPNPQLALQQKARGEVTALLLLYAAVGMVWVSTEHLLTLLVAQVATGLVHLALVTLDGGRTYGAESAAKELMLVCLNLLLMGLTVALGYAAGADTLPELLRTSLQGSVLARVGVVCLLLNVASLLPLLPLHSVRVDVLSGAPSFAGGLMAGSGLLFAGTIVLRGMRALPPSPLFLADTETWLAAISVLIISVPSVAALDQQRVYRTVLYLVVGMVGMLLPVVLVASSGEAHNEELVTLLLGHGALVTFSALVGVAGFEKPNLASTWEDWSGLGQRAPLAASLLLIVLASVVGLPGTFGFSLRLDVAKVAFSAGHVWLGGVVLLAPAVGLAAVARLALFLFTKVPKGGVVVEVSPLRVVLMVLGAIVALAGGIGFSSVRESMTWLLG